MSSGSSYGKKVGRNNRDLRSGGTSIRGSYGKRSGDRISYVRKEKLITERYPDEPESGKWRIT